MSILQYVSPHGAQFLVFLESIFLKSGLEVRPKIIKQKKKERERKGLISSVQAAM